MTPNTVSVERGPQSTVTLRVEVPADRVEEAAERAFHRLVRRTSIPGFRPGKAPRALYERTYGSEHIYEEAARDLVNEALKAAVDEHGLVPLDSPDVAISQLRPRQALVFEATVPVRPTVTLGDYRAHGQKVELAPIPDAEVDAVIERMREAHAELRPVDRAAREGDVALADIDARLRDRDAAPVGRDAHLEAGREYSVKGLGEGIVGAKEGEQRELELAFPEDHPDPELRGRPATFTVKVKQVAEKILPALDDELAKTLGVADVAALRAAVRDELAHAAFHEARDAAAEKAVAHAVDTATLEVPQVLVDDELERMTSELRARLADGGVPFEEFLLRARRTEDDLRKEWAETARRRAASLLVLEEVARAEGITVTDQELARELAAMRVDERDAARLGTPQVLGALARSIRNRKVVDRLIALDSPDAERELLAKAGAVPERAGRASGLVLPGEGPPAKIVTARR